MLIEPPTVEQVVALGTMYECVVPAEWQDLNGHVNVRHYLDLYNAAGEGQLLQLGVDSAYFHKERRGFFDLEHHIWYLAEIHVGDRLTVHMRYVGRSVKRFHGLVFVANRTRERVASILEYVASGADLTTRRSAAFPPHVSERLDALVSAHASLPWKAPVCGVMRA